MVKGNLKNIYNMEVIKNPLSNYKRNYHLEHEVDNLQNRLNLNMNTLKNLQLKDKTSNGNPQKDCPLIERRGSGGDFQQVGMLYKNNMLNRSTPGNNTYNNVLPLYGNHTGSNKFLYYTETDKLNPIKIR